jgi:AI-2 transport protein TqsA
MGNSIAVKIIGVAAAAALVYFFRPILAPLCLAFVIVVMIHWIGDGISRMWPKASRWVVTALTAVLVAATMLTGFAIISGGITRLLPRSDRIAGRLGELIDAIGSYVGPFGRLTNLDMRPLIDQANLSSLVQGALQQIASGLSGLALTLLLVGFLLPGRPKLNAKLIALTHTSEAAMEGTRVLWRVVRGVRHTVLVQLAAAAITASVAAVAMSVLGMPEVAFWTVLVFLISLVPVVGGSVAALLVAAFALIDLPTFEQVLLLAALIQGSYLFAGSVFVPRMQSARSNLDPVVGLAFVGIWSLLWGIPGALLANSLTVVMMVIFAEFDSTRWVSVLMSNDGKPGE